VQLQAFERNGGCTEAELEACFAGGPGVHGSELRSPDAPRPDGSHDQSAEPATPWGNGPPFPDELPSDGEYVEGLAREVLINAFERSVEARNACIAHFGIACQVCGFDFGSKYGPIGNGFIHVHHRVPIASIGQEYTVKPLEDLVPVCPNCHAMLHRREPPLSVAELRAMLIGEPDC
jgi:hypothetical protein